ncbi:MAG: serine hydrolase domain-containing protein [Saprospiraceae bacterium]
MKLLFFLILICLFSSTCINSDHYSISHDLVVGLPQTDPLKDPGFALKITSWDSVVMEAYEGVEDIHTLTPINGNSLFNIGSISKTFVAFCILRLASEGKLSLSDSLIKYFPAFKNQEIGKKVRLYHLLTHSSGLPDNRKIKQDSIFYLTADDAQNWAPILENDSLHFAPGSKYEYSNPAFNALALIIQQVTGLKWQDYIKIKIFTPSHMKHSTITDGPHPDTGVTHAYVPLPNHQWQELDYGEEPTFNASGNGGVWSSVNELIKYEHAIGMNDFVEGEIRQQARTIYPLKEWTDPKPSQIGLCWFISKYQGQDMYSHTGSQGGFTADFVSIPDAGFFYCILTNTPVDIIATRVKVLEHAVNKGWIKVVK